MTLPSRDWRAHRPRHSDNNNNLFNETKISETNPSEIKIPPPEIKEDKEAKEAKEAKTPPSTPRPGVP